MNKDERILKAIYQAVDTLNQGLVAESRIEKAPNAELYGRSSRLESLDFVTLIMAVEANIQKEFGVEFMITDEELLSKETSPFATLGTLSDYLGKQLEDQSA
ncbi:MAG TPA: hypothetical protein VGO90_03685 [Chthoniobacteraceae bacterium]|jgi:acyl carrier protein|nr:hypothetical protein [Chthoniobacteraceae bacterium]